MTFSVLFPVPAITLSQEALKCATLLVYVLSAFKSQKSMLINRHIIYEIHNPGPYRILTLKHKFNIVDEPKYLTWWFSSYIMEIRNPALISQLLTLSLRRVIVQREMFYLQVKCHVCITFSVMNSFCSHLLVSSVLSFAYECIVTYPRNTTKV